MWRRWAFCRQELKTRAGAGDRVWVQGVGPSDMSGRSEREVGEVGGLSWGIRGSLQTGRVVQIFPKNQASPHSEGEVKICCLRPGFPGDLVFYSPK